MINVDDMCRSVLVAQKPAAEEQVHRAEPRAYLGEVYRCHARAREEASTWHYAASGAPSLPFGDIAATHAEGSAIDFKSAAKISRDLLQRREDRREMGFKPRKFATAAADLAGQRKLPIEDQTTCII